MQRCNSYSQWQEDSARQLKRAGPEGARDERAPGDTRPSLETFFLKELIYLFGCDGSFSSWHTGSPVVLYGLQRV